MLIFWLNKCAVVSCVSKYVCLAYVGEFNRFFWESEIRGFFLGAVLMMRGFKLVVMGISRHTMYVHVTFTRCALTSFALILHTNLS